MSDAIFNYARNGNVQGVQQRLDRSPGCIEARDALTGQTPLHCSVEFNATGVLQLLLARKAKIEAKDKPFEIPFLMSSPGGQTGLHTAAVHGNVTAARLLLQHGAQVRAVLHAYPLLFFSY